MKELKAATDITIDKFLGPTLYMNKSESNDQFLSGYYEGMNYTVGIWIVLGEPLTELSMNLQGNEYKRTYNRTFENRGLKMICARFIKDVANLASM